MELFFLTKDFNADYPVVNWQPMQPPPLKNIGLGFSTPPNRWHDFSHLGYVLEGDGNQIKLLVTGLDSGRLDYTNCHIVVCLLIVASVSELKSSTGSKLDNFICELILNTLPKINARDGVRGRSEKLLSVFDILKNGELVDLENNKSKSKKIAQNMLDNILNITLDEPYQIIKESFANPLFFFGGISNQETQSKFLSYCQAILLGECRGDALSYCYVNEQCVDALFKERNGQRSVGVLINNIKQQTTPLKILDLSKNILFDKQKKKVRNNPDRNLIGKSKQSWQENFKEFIPIILEFFKNLFEQSNKTR